MMFELSGRLITKGCSGVGRALSTNVPPNRFTDWAKTGKPDGDAQGDTRRGGGAYTHQGDSLPARSPVHQRAEVDQQPEIAK